MKNAQPLQCPVCGMDIVNEDHALEHFKVTYLFCSAQCRDNFEDHPSLYLGNRAKAHNEVIKTKRIRLSEPQTPESALSIKENLQQLMGVKEIELQGRTLQIRYDLIQATFAQIEDAIKEFGDVLDNAWWQRFRRGWTRYTEDNELRNLATPQGACCNRPPPRA